MRLIITILVTSHIVMIVSVGETAAVMVKVIVTVC